MGVIGVVLFFAVLGLMSPKHHPQPSAITRSDGRSRTQLQPEAAPLPGLNVATASKPSAVTPLVSSPPLQAFLRFETGNLAGADMKSDTLYEQLDLQKRGFILNKFSDDSREFRTFRKTDSQREYTAIAMAGTDERITAVTAELVAADPALNSLAKSYFSAFLSPLLDSPSRDQAIKWLDNQIGTVTSQNFGKITLSLAGTSETHRRLTIQPTSK